MPLCPNALIDDGLLDLTILPELERKARAEAFSRLLREGAAAIPAQLATAQSPWIEVESADGLDVNLDGEPMLVKRFRVECLPRALPVRLGESAPLSRPHAAFERSIWPAIDVLECLTRARRQGRARFAGRGRPKGARLSTGYARALTPPRGSALWPPWTLLRGPGRKAGPVSKVVRQSPRRDGVVTRRAGAKRRTGEA